MQKINSGYITMLRKLVRGGCKREEFRYTKSNAEILQVCKTADIPSFVLEQQTSYLGNLARQSNKCLTKRLLFNDDKRLKQGRPFETVEDKVLKNSSLTRDQFYKNAMKMKNGHDHTNGVDRRLSSQ